MPARPIAPLLFGLMGAAILVGLGVWQLQRLQWKSGVLAEIEARIAAPPASLPENPDPVRDRYLPVTLTGTLAGPEAHVLTSRRETGPGFRVIAAIQIAEGRMVMADLGFVPEADLATPRPAGPITLTGNLHWPDEADSFTPAPDAVRNIWFARDVDDMAAALQTEPTLLIARATDPVLPAITPWPVDASGIANNHLQYAITWFSLAVVWLGMTALWLWRIRQRPD